MLNLDHQNPSAVRRDENASNIANHIKKEEQLRQKLDLERASKRELVERLHAEKEEIKHKSKLVVDMFKQKIAETESQLISSKDHLDHVYHRSSLTGELLRDHIAKWKLWNETLQGCDNMEVFAEYLLNQPMKFICESDSIAVVGVSAPSEIPSLMITELDQILNFITNVDLKVQLDNLPYFTVVPVVGSIQTKAARSGEGGRSNVSIKTSSKDETTKPGMSPLRRPLSSLDTNTGVFSASSSPLQSPVSARVPRPLSSRGSSKKRSSGIGMPGSPSFSFFEDDTPEHVCLACVASAASAVEAREQVAELTSRLSVSEELVTTHEQRCNALETAQSVTQGNLTKAEECIAGLGSEKEDLHSQLAAELGARTQAEQQLSSLHQEHSTLSATLTIECAARVQAEQQVEVLGATVQKLEAKVLRLKGALEKSKQETTDVRETLQRERDTHSNLLLHHTIELEAAALAASQRANEFNAQLEVFKALAAGPTSTIAALEADLKTKDTELKEMSNQLAQQFQTMTASESELRTLLEESQHRGEEEKCASVRAQEALRADLHRMEEVCGQLDCFAQRRNDEAIVLAVKLQAKKEEHAAELESLSAQLLESSAALKASWEVVLVRDNEVRVLSDQLTGREAIIAVLEKKIDEVESARVVLLVELSSNSLSLQGSSGRVTELEALVSELQTQLEDSTRLAQQEFSEFAEDFNRKSAEDRLEAVRVLRVAQEEHTQAVRVLQEQLDQELVRVQNLTSQLQDRDAEVQMLSTTLMSQSEVKNLLVAAKLEADAQTSELEELKRRFAEQTEEVAVKRSAMVARIALLTEDLQSREATIVSLSGAADVARSETTAEMESLSSRLNASESRVVLLTQEAAVLHEKYMSVCEAHDLDAESLRQLLEESALLKDQLSALEAAAQVEKSTLEEHIADLEQQYGESCDVKCRLEEELESASARCRELEEQAVEHSIQAASFEAQRLVWESAVAERDQLHAASTGETVELSQQLQQSVFRAQALESTLKECESELELFKDCNERVSAERDEAQEQLETTAVALEETQSELALLQTRARGLKEECAKFKILQQEHTGELASLIIVHEEKMSKLQQRLIEAEQESKQSATEAEVLRTKLRECESAIAESHNTLAKRNMELDVLQQSLRETERIKDAVEVKFTELEESYLRVVGKLEVRIADLVIERDTLRESASQLRAESESTGSSLSDSHAAVAELQRAAEAYLVEIESLTTELSSQRQAMMSVSAELDTQSQALADLETQLSEQSKSFEAEKKSVVEGIQAQQIAFTSALIELQNKSDHAVSSLRSNLLASLALEQNEVKDLVAKIAARELQYDALSVQFADLASQEERVRSERDVLLSNNQNLHSIIAEVNVELESTRTKMEELKAQGQELNLCIEERGQELVQLRATIADMQAEITTAREHAVEREESIYGLQLCVQATEQDRIALQKTFNATTAAHMSVVSDAAEKLGVVAQERDAVQAERDALAVTVAGLKIEVDALGHELTLAQATATELESAAKAATLTHASEVEGISSRLESSAAAVAELENRLREFEASCASSSEQLRLTLEQRDSLRAELAIANGALSEQARVHGELCARYEELTSSVESTKQALAEAQETVTATETLRREATEVADAHRLESASASVQAISLQESVENLQSDISAKDATIQDLRERLQASELELTTSAAQLNDQLCASVLQVERLECQIVKKVAATEALTRELHALQAAHEELVGSAESAAVTHSSTVAELSAQIESLEQATTELRRELELVVQERNDLRGIRGSLTVQVMNLQGTISALQVSSSEQGKSLLQTELDVAVKNAALLQAETLLQDAQRKCDALSADLTAKEEEVAMLTVEIAESKAALMSCENVMAELTESVAERTQEISDMSSSTSAQIAALEAHLSATLEAVAAHETTINGLKVQVTELESTRIALQVAAQAAEEKHQTILAERVSRAEGLESRLRDLEAVGADSSEQLRVTLEQRDFLQTERAAVSADLRSARQTIADLEAAVEKKTAAHAEILAELIARLEELSSVRADLEHQDNIHREAMGAAEAERVQWKHLAAQRDFALCQVIREFSSANLECTALSAEVAANQDAERVLVLRSTLLEQRILVLESALRELDECVVERNQELDSLAASSADAIAQRDASLQDLLMQLQDSEAALEAARAASLVATESHASALEQVQARVRELETLGATTSEQLALTLAQRDALQDKQSELLMTIAALEAEVEGTQQRTSALEQELVDVRAVLAAQLCVAEERLVAARNDLASSQEASASLQVKLTNMQCELAAQSTQHDQAVSSLQSLVDGKNQALDETAAALFGAEQTRCALDLECVALSSEIAALSESEVVLLSRLSVLEQRTRVAESAVRELDECAAVCNADLISLQESTAAAAVTFTAAVASARQRVAAQDEQIQQLTSALEEAAQKFIDAEIATAAESSLAAGREQILTQQWDALLTSCKELEDQLRVAKHDFRQLELVHAASVAQLNSDISSHCECMEEQKSLINQLQTELAVVRDALETSQQSVSALQASTAAGALQHAEAVSDFESRIGTLQAERTACVAALESRLREFEAAGASSSEQLRLTLEQRDSLQAEFEALTRSMFEKTSELTSLQQHLEEISARHADEVTALQSTLQEVRTECANSQAATSCQEAECAALTSNLSNKVQEIETLTSEICSLTADIQTVKETIQDRDACILNLESAALESTEEMAALQADLASAMQKSSDLSHALATRDSEIVARALHYNALSRQLVEHIDRVDECEHELVALQHEVYLSDALVVRLRAKLYAAESAVRDLDHDCLEKNRDIETLASTSSAATAEAVETITRLEAIIVENENTIQTLKTAQTALENSLAANLTSHEQVLGAQREHLRVVENSNAEAIEALEIRLREFEALGASSSEQLRLALVQREALQAERDGLQQAIISLEAQLSSLQASLSAADQTIADVKMSAEVAAATAAEQLSEAETKATTLQTELNSTQDKLLTAGNELTTLTANLQQQSGDHSATVASMRSELDQRSACLKQISQALAGAEDRMEQTSAEMKTYESLLTSAQTQLTNCTDEISRLKSALAEAESAKQYLEESVALGRAENAEVEDQRCAAELRCSSLESNLLDVEKNLRIALKESASLAAQLAEQTAHFDGLVKAAQGSEESLLIQNAQLCSDIAGAQEEIRRVTELCVAKDDLCQTLEGQLRDLREQSEVHTNRVAELEASVEALSETIAVAQADLERTCGELETTKTSFSTERDEMQAQSTALNATVQSFETTIGDLQAQLQVALAECETRNGTIAELTEQVSNNLAASDVTVEELTSRIAALSAELAENVVQQQTLEAQVLELSAQCAADRTRISELSGTVQFLTDSLATTRAELEANTSAAESSQEKLQAQIVEFEGAVQSLQGTIVELEGQIMAASVDAAAHANTIDDLTVQLSTVREAYAAAEQQLTSQLDALSAESETRNTRIVKLSDTVQSLNERIMITQAERDELQVRVVAMESSVDDLQSTIAALEEQLTAASTQSATQAEMVSQLTSQLDADQKASFAVVEQLESKISSLSGELATAHDELKLAIDESVSRSSRCQVLESQVCEQNARIEAHEAHIVELEATVESLTERIAATESDLQSSRATLESTKKSSGAERDELSVLVGSLRAAVAQLENQLYSAAADSVAHIETIDQLTEQLEVSRAACSAAEDTVKKLSAQNDDLAACVAARDTHIAGLQSEVESKRSTGSAQAIELSTTTGQLKKEQKRTQQLEKNLRHSEEQVRAQERLVEEKSAALSELKDELFRSEKQIEVLMADATRAALLLKKVQADLLQEKEIHSACADSEGRANAQIVELETRIGELQAQLTRATDAALCHSEVIHQLSEELAASRDAHTTSEEICTKLSVLNRDLTCTSEERATKISELQFELQEVHDSAAVRIDTLESTLSQLRAQLADSCAHREKETQTVEDLTKQLEEEKDALTMLKEQLGDASAALKEAENEITRVYAEIESLKTDSIATAAHIQNIEQLLAESEVAHARSMSSLDNLSAEFAALHTEANKCAEELTATKSTLERLNRSTAVNASLVASLEKQLLVAQDDLEESQASTRLLAVELAQMKEEDGALRVEAERRCAAILSLEQQLSTLTEESTATENRLREASAKVIGDLQAQVHNLSTQLAASTDVADAQKQLSSVRDAELDAIQQDLLTVRHSLASALATAEEEQSAHELESLNLNGKIAEKEFAIRELTAEIETCAEEMRQHQELVATTNAKLQEAEKRVEELTNEKEDLEAQLAQLQVEHSRVQGCLADMESASHSNTAKLQLDQASLHGLATELVEVKAAFQHCQGQLREHKISVSALKAEVARKTESFLLLEHRLAEKVSAESALLSDLATFQQHEATLKAELKKSHADVSALSARLNESVAELSHAQDAHNNELHLLKQNIQQREFVLQELNDRLLEQMEQSDELKRQMQEANAASSKMNRDLKERNDELEELHVEHGVLGAQEHIHSKEISDLKAQLHGAETALASLRQELHVRTLESADLAVSMKQRQGGIQQLTVTLTDKDKQIQQIHSEMTAVRNKLRAAEEKSVKLDIQIKSLTNVVNDLRVLQASQEKVLEQERDRWAVDSGELISRIQESEFIIQELNDRIVENEKVIAGYESNVQETQSERQHLEFQFLNIRDQLQANLAQCAELKQAPVCIPITSTVIADMSNESAQAMEKLLQQKDNELKAQSARFEDLEVHTNQRVESIREALATQFEAQAAAQHIESHMLEDKVATLEGLLAAAQHELQQYHESHPEPAEGAVVAQDSEELRALQAGVVRMKAKVASKSKQILLLNQQMLRDRQNFHKLKKSLVKLDELKAMVFANNFNPAVPAPPLPPNQVSELFHLGMEEATKKIEKKQQVLLAQQQEEFQVIRDNLENTLSSLELQATTIPTSESLSALSDTIHALRGELRDQAAAHNESQRKVQEMRERISSKEATHYLALSEKNVECNALRAALEDLEKRHCSTERTPEMDSDVASLQEQLRLAQLELQVMTQRQAEGSQKFQRAVHTIKVLEARGDSLKEECAAANGEILKLFQKSSSRKK